MQGEARNAERAFMDGEKLKSERASSDAEVVSATKGGEGGRGILDVLALLRPNPAPGPDSPS